MRNLEVKVSPVPIISLFNEEKHFNHLWKNLKSILYICICLQFTECIRSESMINNRLNLKAMVHVH